MSVWMPNLSNTLRALIAFKRPKPFNQNSIINKKDPGVQAVAIIHASTFVLKNLTFPSLHLGYAAIFIANKDHR